MGRGGEGECEKLSTDAAENKQLFLHNQSLLVPSILLGGLLVPPYCGSRSKEDKPKINYK